MFHKEYSATIVSLDLPMMFGAKTSFDLRSEASMFAYVSIGHSIIHTHNTYGYIAKLEERKFQLGNDN